MSRRWRKVLACALCVATNPALAAADEASNWERLRSMPRERREALLDGLKQFDALAPAEKASLRALDAAIAKKPAADQARYFSVLRRYHLWVEGLPEAQRNQIRGAAPEERMKLVARFRAEERHAGPRRASPRFMQIIDVGPWSPFELAHQIRVWQTLSPAEQGKLDKLANPAEAQQRLRELGKGLKLKAETKLLKQEEEELLTKMEAQLQDTKAGWNLPLLRKKEGAKDTRRLKLWAENYYFVEHPPQAVRPDNLLRFEASLPRWIRESFDHLPADEARRRLTVLYRLVYPAGQEMPASKGPAEPAPAAKDARVKAIPAPARPAPKPGGSNPF